MSKASIQTYLLKHAVCVILLFIVDLGLHEVVVIENRTCSYAKNVSQLSQSVRCWLLNSPNSFWCL